MNTFRFNNIYKDIESTFKTSVISHTPIFQIAKNVTIAQTIISTALILFFWQGFPPKIPLWLNRPWGTDRLAPPWMLFILPLSGIIFFIVNSLIATKLSKQHHVFLYALMVTSIILNIAVIVDLIGIIQIML